MVRCKGCGVTTSSPRAQNWQQHQMCYKCAKIHFPQDYLGKPNHGTGKSRMGQEPVPQSIYESTRMTKRMNSSLGA